MKPTYDVLAFGVAAVDDRLYVAEYPAANSKAPIVRSGRSPGGLATTAAAAVGRLGGKAAYVARFAPSGDELSTYMAAQLQQAGVDTSHLIDDPTAGPFHSTIIVDNGGTRTIFYDSSRYRQITAADVSDELIRSSRVCFIDYIQDPPAIDLAQKIRACGVPILADIEGRSQTSLPLLPLIDYLIVSDDFARWATGARDLKEACRRLASNPRAATVVTAGAKGCYLGIPPDTACLMDSDEPVHIPTFSIQAVDTTGCGDTFHGAFALAVAWKLSPADAAVFASAAAALKATRGGGWNAIPTLSDLVGFLSQRLSTAQRAFLDRLADARPQ